MGRPRGSRNTRDVTVIGAIDVGTTSFTWEQELLAQLFTEVLATRKDQQHEVQEVDHDASSA